MIGRTKCVLVWITVLLVSGSLAGPVPQATGDIAYVSFLNSLDADKTWSIVNDLAGDRFEGRMSGTRGADLASMYIADYFHSAGLKPAGDAGTYRTKFTVPLWQVTEIPSLALVDATDGALQVFEYRRDFKVVPGSGGGSYTTEVVFAGYGITAKDVGYDDYAGISARGKIVLAIIGAPPYDRFEKGNYGASYTKAENALSHGAVGLILIDSPADPTTHYAETRRCDCCCWTIYDGLTILGGTIGMADTLLKDSGLTLDSVQQTINQGFKPQSFSTGKLLRESVQVSFTANADAYNVLGFIPGSDPDASKKVVIIGAHYDHWGKDIDWSVYRGANDDASGVAVMMEIARIFSAAVKSRWSLLFTAWSGEEEGFYGSYDYVNHPYFPLSGTIAYLNLEMVGYGDRLLAEASEAHKALRTVVTESAKELNIPLDVEGYYGASDHASFEEKHIQNVMFIYWPDEAYHTPSDTADHVSKRNLLETARLTAMIALKLSEARVIAIPATPATTVAETQTATTTLPQVATGIFRIEFFMIACAVLVISVAGVLYLRREK